MVAAKAVGRQQCTGGWHCCAQSPRVSSGKRARGASADGRNLRGPPVRGFDGGSSSLAVWCAPPAGAGACAVRAVCSLLSGDTCQGCVPIAVVKVNALLSISCDCSFLVPTLNIHTRTLNTRPLVDKGIMHAHSLRKLGEACYQRTSHTASNAREEFRHTHAIQATEPGENTHTTVRFLSRADQAMARRLSRSNCQTLHEPHAAQKYKQNTRISWTTAKNMCSHTVPTRGWEREAQ